MTRSWTGSCGHSYQGSSRHQQHHSSHTAHPLANFTYVCQRSPSHHTIPDSCRLPLVCWLPTHLLLSSEVCTPTQLNRTSYCLNDHCQNSKPLLMASHSWFRCASTTGTALSTLVGSSWSQRGSGTTSVPWPAVLLRPSTWSSLMSPRMWRLAASRSAPLLLH